MLGLAEGQANRFMIHGGTRAFGAAYKIRDVVVQNSRPQGSTFVTLQKLGTSLDFQGAVRGMRGRAGNTKAPALMEAWAGTIHYPKARAPSDGALGALDRGIQPDNTPWKETGRTRLEFSALLEVKLLPLSMPSNGFPCAWHDMLGNRCSENTGGRMKIAAALAAALEEV